VSAYPFPASSPTVPPAATADPTAVFGRRVGAIVVDFLLYLLMLSFIGPTPLSPLAEYFEVPDGASDVCDQVRDVDDDVFQCAEVGDRVYFTTTDDIPVQAVVFIGFVGLYAALQGATGLTPGKAIFGVRVVDERGGRPGFGRSLARTLLWVVDILPCLGIVALVTGLTTTGHRRVGDMAAKTFVVGKRHVGPVIVPGLTTGAGGGAPAGPWGGQPGAAGPPWGGPPQQPTPAAWGGPPAGG
jgi:uncharacterized RDD family membrane protein YckC